MFLTPLTVFDDLAADAFVGVLGLDWFWRLAAEANDQVIGERNA